MGLLILAWGPRWMRFSYSLWMAGMNKRVAGFVGAFALLCSMSAHAQLSSLFQAAQEQVMGAAQTQANRGVRAATDTAIESAKTRASQAVDAARSPSVKVLEGEAVKAKE
jgi:hypothetical protein